jgi:beta-lactamase regulating signal transducer with metallopeptidase domain
MTSELLSVLGKMNLAAAAAVLAVILLRAPVRAMFGARLAYLVWLIVPAAALAVLIPARTVIVEAVFSAVPAAAAQPAANPWPLVAGLWAVGVVATAGWFLCKQLQFLAEARRGRAGPAVVGVLRPRIVTPSDFEQVFCPREREVIIAHERTHIARADTLMNSLAALVQCLFWFNPLIHVGAHLMRIDQELACDAQVVERHPKARRTYAAAMLKAELADRPLPLGCYWPAGTLHPLTKRVAMLKYETPGALRRAAGAVSLIALFAGAGFAAWAAQPDRIEYVEPQRTGAQEIEKPSPAPPKPQDGFVNVPKDKAVPLPLEKPQVEREPESGQGRRDGFVPVPVEKPQRQGAVIDPRLEGHDGNGQPYILTADTARRSSQTGEIELSNPRFTSSSGVIVADRAVLNENARTLVFSSNVVKQEGANTLRAVQLPVPLEGFPPAAEPQPAPEPQEAKPPKTKAEVQEKIDILRNVEKKKAVDAKVIKGPKKDLRPEVAAKLKAGKTLSPEVAGKLKEGKKELPPEVAAKLKKVEQGEGSATQPKKPN